LYTKELQQSAIVAEVLLPSVFPWDHAGFFRPVAVISAYVFSQRPPAARFLFARAVFDGRGTICHPTGSGNPDGFLMGRRSGPGLEDFSNKFRVKKTPPAGLLDSPLAFRLVSVGLWVVRGL